MLLACTLLASLLAPQGTDTTVPVRAGSRLELSGSDGAITVQVWRRDAVRIEADHDEDSRIEVDQGGRTLRLRGRGRYGPSEITWRLTVPADITLDLSSQSGSISVRGTEGEIAIATVEGDIMVQGGGRGISLESVEGDVNLSEGSGRIRVSTVDGEVSLRRVSGDIEVSAVDGNVQLDEVESSSLEVTTVDGGISFTGPIRAGGRYRLSSHDGDVSVTSAGINAEVSVSTFSGNFESDYPVTLSGRHGRSRMTFTLGDGGARLELESFDGTLSLLKAPASRKKP